MRGVVHLDEEMPGSYGIYGYENRASRPVANPFSVQSFARRMIEGAPACLKFCRIHGAYAGASPADPTT